MDNSFKSSIRFVMILAYLSLPFASFAEDAILGKKEFAVTLKNSTPPFNHYNYFDKHSASSLELNNSGYSKINAFLLSDFSTLTYSKPEVAISKIKKFGFSKVKFFTNKGAQAYVSSNDKVVIISFRGTEVAKGSERNQVQMIIDWTTDLQAILKRNKYGEGKVHAGFYNSLNRIWNDLEKYLDDLNLDEKNIFITGHSLGAALGTLAADRLDKNGIKIDSLYTFGSPRVGDVKFKRSLKFDHYRVVNHNDAVTRVPLNEFHYYEDEYYAEMKSSFYERLLRIFRPITYVHSGRLIYIASNGEIFNIMKANDSSESDRNILIDSVLDHTPILYSIGIWNSMVIER